MLAPFIASLVAINPPATTFLITFTGWLVLGALVLLLSPSLIRWMARHAHLATEEIVIAIVRWPLVVLLLFFGVLDAWRRAEGDLVAGEWLAQTVQVLAIAVVAYVTWRFLFEVIVAGLRREEIETERRSHDVAIPILSRIGPVVLIFAVANAVASTFGGSIGAWLTGLGVLSLVLTYVFQEPLQGLFSGTYLALDRSFGPGDLIIVGDNTLYRVQRIGLRVTQVYDVNRHTHVYLPNTKLIAEKIVNVTQPSVELRNVLTVEIDQPRDPRTAVALLVEACNAHENVLGELPAKQKAILARVDAYTAGLTALNTSHELPGQVDELHWIERRIERLNGELVRLRVEAMLRQSGETFSRQLLALARWASQHEPGGLSADERAELKRHVVALMDQFDVLIEEITTWLYLLKVIEYHLVDASYDDAMRHFVARNVDQDGRLLLKELQDCGFPGSPERPLVTRDEVRAGRRADVQAKQNLDRNQFKDRFEYLDYERQYTARHRSITMIYRELLRYFHSDKIEGIEELRLDERLRSLERRFADNFLLNVGHWQLPNATLVSVAGDKLKFDVVYFVDDALRDECLRSERVATELLMEIDRIRSVYQASIGELGLPNGKPTSAPPVGGTPQH